MALDGLIHLLIQEYNENRQNILVNNLNCRNLRDTSNPFELPNGLFLKLFRLDKPTCQYLIEYLGPHLNQRTRISKIPIHLRILTVLHFFGQGSYQTGVGLGHCFAVSQPVVSRCLTEICTVIKEHLANQWIRFPLTQEQKHITKQGFRALSGYFEDCIGIVDGTLIRIVSPPANHPIYPGPVFYCRKNFYALNVQVICDHNKKIINVNARYPGSVHDSAIWMMSNVRQLLHRDYINNNSKDYLLGDSGYPLEPWLLIPVEDAAPDCPDIRYNTALSSVRVNVEHTIGLVKNRFRCIHGQRALYYTPNKVADIIYSCVTLHNIARTRAVPMPVDVEEEPNYVELPVNINPVPDGNDWLNVGVIRRNQIIQRYFVR